MQADEIKMRAFIGNTSLTTDQKNLAVTKLRKCFTGNATVPEQIVRNVLSNQRILHCTETMLLCNDDARIIPISFQPR